MALRATRHLTLPGAARAEVRDWGLAQRTTSWVCRARGVDDVRQTFEAARAAGLTVGLHAGGQSYGDAALNADNVVLDLTPMDRILEWDAHAGIARVEPGVSIARLCHTVIRDGFWPPVVPGTMFATIGGCAAMNVHGKNHWKVGPIGEHILDFDLLLPTGELRRCSPTENADLFHAAIGGFGMLGCFTRLTLRIERVPSGWVRAEPVPAHSLEEMIAIFLERRERADYLVGWVDCFARGPATGRGLVHQGNHVAATDDPDPARSFGPHAQRLPGAILGVVPAGLAWRCVRPFLVDPAVRGVNTVKYHLGRRERTHLQSHTKFTFLLNRMPNWQRAYGPHGLVEYQTFIPTAHAARVFRTQLERAQAVGLTPYMGIFKHHRADAFLMSYGVDGFSLGLDFKVTANNRGRIQALAGELDRLVIEAGGRFYFAKDSTLTRESFAPVRGEERVRRFLAHKAACDPDGLLETNLFRRIFGDAGA
jgi:FAD/FMN-containing dehydrogenase